ncbi:MAG: hypothetical protein LBT83_06710, partial [Tannerella sp.]|nr:hypothetical protein [Tannerella sp.]
MKRNLFLIGLIAGIWNVACTETHPIYTLNEKGGLTNLYFPDTGNDTVQFHSEEFAGPSLFLNEQALALNTNGKEGNYVGSTETLDYGLDYSSSGNQFAITVKCRNRSGKDLENLQFSLQLGINTVMASYPAWRTVYFPTLLRCEQTHFWGYMMNPNGGIITIASPDPVASYHLQYNNYQFDWPKVFGSGHLIRTVTLDLLNPQPLPAGNPLHADRLKKDETRTWTIYLGSVKNLAEVIPATAALTKAPTITADVYTVSEGENVNLTVYGSKQPQLTVTSPDGEKQNLDLKRSKNGVYQVAYTPSSGKGVYQLTAKTPDGKISEACVSV